MAGTTAQAGPQGVPVPVVHTGIDPLDGILNAAIGWQVYTNFNDAANHQQATTTNTPPPPPSGPPSDPRTAGAVPAAAAQNHAGLYIGLGVAALVLVLVVVK